MGLDLLSGGYPGTQAGIGQAFPEEQAMGFTGTGSLAAGESPTPGDAPFSGISITGRRRLTSGA
jgi:hypothetical protein